MEHGARPKIKMKNSGIFRVKKYPKSQPNKHKCSTYNLFHLDKLDKLIEYSHFLSFYLLSHYKTAVI